MSLESIEQNTQTLIEAIYEYDRLKQGKENKKKLTESKNYLSTLIKNIRKKVSEERSEK